MSKMKDYMLRICDIAKDTLVPMFCEEFNVLCIEFSFKPDPFTIKVMVETDIEEEDIEKDDETDDTVKYYIMDIQSLAEEGMKWSDEQFKEHFKNAFEVLKKVPISSENIDFDEWVSY